MSHISFHPPSIGASLAELNLPLNSTAGDIHVSLAGGPPLAMTVFPSKTSIGDEWVDVIVRPDGGLSSSRFQFLNGKCVFRQTVEVVGKDVKIVRSEDDFDADGKGDSLRTIRYEKGVAVSIVIERPSSKDGKYEVAEEVNLPGRPTLWQRLVSLWNAKPFIPVP